MSGCLLVDRFNALAQKSQQLFDGFAWRLVQTFVFPTGGMISLVNPDFSCCTISHPMKHLNVYYINLHDVHGSKRLTPTDFSDPLSFSLAPPWGWYMCPFLKCLKITRPLFKGTFFLFGLLFPKTSGVESESEIGDQQTWLNVTSTQL